MGVGSPSLSSWLRTIITVILARDGGDEALRYFKAALDVLKIHGAVRWSSGLLDSKLTSRQSPGCLSSGRDPLVRSSLFASNAHPNSFAGSSRLLGTKVSPHPFSSLLLLTFTGIDRFSGHNLDKGHEFCDFALEISKLSDPLLAEKVRWYSWGEEWIRAEWMGADGLWGQLGGMLEELEEQYPMEREGGEL